MSDLVVRLAQSLRHVATRGAYVRFRRAMERPRAVQEATLSRLLRDNADCDFGRAHGFRRIASPEDFRRAVPVRDHAATAGDIGRIMAGERGVLTTEPALMFEKTGGSTAAAKYVPYTASLRREFGTAIAAWMHDLHAHRPELRAGRAYWSITPAVREREITPGGLRVGFESDSDYLGPAERWLMRAILAGSPDIARAPDLDAALDATVRALRATPSLRFVSVWHPSFLNLLADRLAPETPAEVWPELRVISCWADAGAASVIPALRDRFPGVEIQGKGLLSTEGVVSIPLTGVTGAVPALTSHYLEFLPEGDAAFATPVHALESGVEYEIVLTTGGGLWRYRTGDRVRVAGRVGATPTLVFTGRDGGVADLRGEKLSDGFVSLVFSTTVLPVLRPGAFAMLAPEEGEPVYSLFTDDPGARSLAVPLDAALRANPQYDYARALGQLAPVRVRIVAGDAFAALLRHAESEGRRAGDVKPASLHPRPGLARAFEGRLS